MREIKRQFRVGLINLKKEPLLTFILWVIGLHALFVTIYATIAILNQ